MMSAIKQIVIVGTGQGGFQVATSLRQEGFSGQITLIGDEPDLPYQRPPLSKAYLKDGNADKLLLRPRSFYEDNNLQLVTCERVIRIRRELSQLDTASGQKYLYDHLIIATGARNVLPPLRGIDLAGVHTMRTLSDAARIRIELAGAKHVLVVGGGFIGLEFAAVARSLGHKVTVIEGAPRLLARAVSRAMSDAFKQLHEDLGVRLAFGSGVEEILASADGRACGVRLANGEVIDGDMVLVAVGVRPNDELAADAGLQVRNGIVVNNQLLTEDPAISAMGDCAAFPDPVSGAAIRPESIQAATDQARLIAKRIASGQDVPYAASAWFWSDQASWKLQIAGLGADADEEVPLKRDDGKILVFRFRKGILLALETVNAAADHMAARKLLQSGRQISISQLKERNFDVVGLAKEQKAQT